ncbi:HET domain-containing protein [Fusarium falciforme]|uniref:HET domain-containing protein n=1 Tax=Fusarium falciforme TaxID=195108 RepID=UPI0023011C3E|nr:HET domain-containing protein [Fusarium falciforme]WAO92201.1 HET domain-containing protein [Fusarium falciforme]
MHKTFADAIAITRGLGIPYLWIDALCIVQGDGGEFESEAGKMAAYYKNAELTLAATDSIDCEGGMLYPSNLRQKFNTSRFRHRDKAAYAFLDSIQTDLESEINSAPLNQRGWALQEGILSRRMVHFSKKQLIWECKTKVASEDGLVDLKKDKIRRPFALPTLWVPLESRYEEWAAVVQGYSGRLLSKARDKTLALAGATTQFIHLLRDEPLVGLWRGDLPAGLLWRATEPRGRVKAVELKSIPSWSWMILDGPVRFNTGRRRSVLSSWIFTTEMKVDEAFVRWKGEELTSEVTQTYLRVSGRLIPFNPASTTVEDIWWDSPSRPDENLFLLAVGQVSHRVRRTWNSAVVSESKDYFLVLCQTAKKNEYSRVGMGVVDNGQEVGGHFAAQSAKTIVLV